MTRNIRRHNSIQSTFKDYLVPIIGGVVILILLYSFFNGDSTTPPSENTDENRNPTQVSFSSVDTQASITYPGNIEEKINDSHSFYKGETLIIKEGIVSLSTPNGSKISLNKIAKLKYEEDGSYSLYSSDAWFTLASDTIISMKFANIDASAGTVLSLTQNEAGSTIYVLAGSAKITNLAGVSTLLIKGQKISVSRLNAANGDIDLGSEKSNIDSYFKGSDWFIENQGHLTLQQEETTTKDDDDKTNTSTSGTSGKYISFDILRDEMSIKTNSLNILGTILSEEVGSITINNRQANISVATKSFSLDTLSLNQTVNDIVVKIYDTNRNVIQKSVYTVYTSSKSGTTQATNNTSVASSQGVTIYDVDATDFAFTEPSNTGKFSTTSSEITIRGITTAKGISRVEVNGFKLASYNGSTWRYHAFERFETLEEGTNQYRVDYFGENGKIAYTDYYTIVKKAVKTAAPIEEVTEEKVVSGEAKPE